MTEEKKNEREKHLAEERLFEESLNQKTQTKKNYLGDRQTIETMLRFYMADLLERLDEASTEKEKKQVIDEVTKEVGKILLGKEGRKFTPVRKWNKFHFIDKFLAKWLGLKETDPDERMQHAVLKMVDELLDIVNFAGTPGVLDEQWQPAYDELITKYTSLFLGYDPITRSLVDIK